MIDIGKKCSGCYGCYNICPKGAIEMKDDEKGFKYPVINKEKCIGCKLCLKVCPVLNKKDSLNLPISYASYNKDIEIRKSSSSGGIFSLLASYILDNDGIIYGAAFNNRWQVEHIRINNKVDLEKLRTSKYLQSNINDTYKLAKEDLDNDKTVLFTGTPCQVNGFISYLNGKKYDKLYTQDVICHGVPSPKVWIKYLNYRENNDKGHPTKINFREKEKGWGLFSMYFAYKKNSYKQTHKDDIYMKAFLNDVCLRDSCYKCSFRSKSRIADITLADFWGIDNVVPNFNDDMGVSLVILNTEKGIELFEKIKSKTVFERTDFEESIKFNKSMYESPEIPKNRKRFFKNLDKMEFDKLVKKYASFNKISLIKRILRKMKKIITNIKSV